jgi:ribose transport system permease protein
MSNISSDRVFLLAPILLLFLLLSIGVIRGPNLVSMSGMGSAIIVSAPLILATYALMAVAVAGRGTVDLAVGPLLGFINVSVVQLNGLGMVTSPWGVFILALGLGVLYQILFALIIIFVRVQPIIVSLSGFLALSGINLVILPRPGGIAPEWMYSWGFGESIFSPVLLIILIATAGWLLFTLTPFYRHLRMMGFDERSAYTSGVRIYIVRIGAHIISGIFIGLASLCYTSLISSGDPTQGTTYTLTAVTALVLGGVSLAGGRGGVTGALLGALNLFLIGYVLSTFNFGGIQAFVTQLSYGLILVLSLLLTVIIPLISRFIRYISPFALFIVLTALFVGTMLHVKTKNQYFAPEDTTQVAQPFAHSLNGSDSDDGISQYMLVPPPVSSYGQGLELSPIQQMVLMSLVGVLMMVVTFRFAVVEAQTNQMSPLLYGFIGLLITLFLIVVAFQSRADNHIDIPHTQIRGEVIS